MKLLGLVGGSSWVSSGEYYAHINRMVNERVGGVDAAKLVLWSMNFGDIQRNNLANDQRANMRLILEGCQRVEAAGAKGVMICANTLHMFADEIQPQIGIPIIHLVTAVADTLKFAGITQALLMGTKYTMEMPYIREKLSADGVEPVLPDEADRDFMHKTIYEELVSNIFTEPTRRRYLEIIEKARGEGVEGAILACTEIPILLEGFEVALPTFDTLLIHSKAAADFMLS